MCFGVFERWSSPRMTWVMPISISSTTLTKWKIHEPSGASDGHVRLEVAERIDGLGPVDFHVAADEVIHDDELARQS